MADPGAAHPVPHRGWWRPGPPAVPRTGTPLLVQGGAGLRGASPEIPQAQSCAAEGWVRLLQARLPASGAASADPGGLLDGAAKAQVAVPGCSRSAATTTWTTTMTTWMATAMMTTTPMTWGGKATTGWGTTGMGAARLPEAVTLPTRFWAWRDSSGPSRRRAPAGSARTAQAWSSRWRGSTAAERVRSLPRRRRGGRETGGSRLEWPSIRRQTGPRRLTTLWQRAGSIGVPLTAGLATSASRFVAS
mmetsp:Transcript_2346/g.9182  ORF Transcript_2346/g.9182 Transcript_2346/m.9182 type:complete len:247 (-) Transcript_2346:1985-2725(-)